MKHTSWRIFLALLTLSLATLLYCRRVFLSATEDDTTITHYSVNTAGASTDLKFYSLWLQPPATSALSHALTRFIEKVHRSGHNSSVHPKFSPHVTLVGTFASANQTHVRRRVSALAADLRQWQPAAPASAHPESMPPHSREIAFSGVSTGDSFFRCVYLMVQNTPFLSEAHLRARRAFDLPATDIAPASAASPAYMPHLSLAYGSLSPPARLALQRRAEDELLPLPGAETSPASAGLGDAGTGSEGEGEGGVGGPLQGRLGGFEAASVALWETDVADRSCRSWRLVASFSLLRAGTEHLAGTAS
jgi:hypothetical protein